MIISKTPFRMSFFGGGTDFPTFYEKNGGAVISATFDKYCYVVVRHLPRFFDYSSELCYAVTERVRKIDEIKHPAIRNAMKMLDISEIRLSYEADLPARSGLGTSSAFAVGMLNAFYAIKGKFADKRRLADDAIRLERVLCDEKGGIQDQIASSFGGFNRIEFSADGYSVRPLIISPQRKKALNDSLLLFFTGFSRFSSDIQSDTEKSVQKNDSRLFEIQAMTDEAEKILQSNASLDDFGRLLGESWKVKRGISTKISRDAIDSLYRRGISAGAIGGKLLGAGGGGFLLFYAPEDCRENVKKALSDLLFVPFSFESAGTQIIYYTADGE